MLSRYQNIIQKANYIFFIVLVCSLPFPTLFSLYSFRIWLFTWILEGRFLKSENRQLNKGTIPIIALTILLFWEFISYTWAIHKDDTSSMIMRHLLYVAILPVAIYGVNSQYNWRSIAKWFIVSCIASLFIYGIYLYIIQFWQYISIHHKIPSPVLSWEWFGYHISPIKHRAYYAYILNLAVVALLHINPWRSDVSKHKKTRICLFLLALAVLITGVAWSCSRANVLILIVIIAIAIVQPLQGRTRLVAISLAAVMGLILVVMTVVLHPRFENFNIKHITDRATYQTEQIEPRINIWYVAMQNPQDYIWYGLGAGGDKKYLASLYDSQNWDHFYERKYNTHNQYLGILVGLGIFAAIFFLLIWFLYPLWYSNKAKHIATLFAIIIGSNMLTENMLDRIDGVIITCVSMLAIVLFSRAQLSK